MKFLTAVVKNVACQIILLWNVDEFTYIRESRTGTHQPLFKTNSIFNLHYVQNVNYYSIHATW